MDSINKQQPEQNRRDLDGAEAVKRVQDMVDDATSCFFGTDGAIGPSRGVRPMSVREVDEARAHAGFLELEGRAEVLTDRARIKDLWNFMLRTWFTEGEDDPRITVIRFVPQRGYYWDNKHGNAIAGAKLAVGAAIGKTLDDSIEGQLRF